MKQLYCAVVLYTVLGLVAGLFYRDFTKAHNFTGKTELAVTHTHLLALGTLFFLIVIGLEKQFTLSSGGLYRWFFWTYNVGVLIRLHPAEPRPRWQPVAVEGICTA